MSQGVLHLRKNFSIVRLSAKDAAGKSDHFMDFKRLALESEPLYPGFSNWLDSKVSTGLVTGERSCFVAYLGSKPAVTAVVKHGEQSKFCHLKVSTEIRDQNIGELFFCLMAAEVRGKASEIHFTLPESLWEVKGNFFESFGFSKASLALDQYRTTENEFRCSASFDTVWSRVVSKASKLLSLYRLGEERSHADMLLSIKPRWANAILDGRKRFEIRRTFSHRWKGRRAYLYASTPVQSIVGHVTIDKAHCDSPDRIWERFGDSLECTRDEFDSYVTGALEVWALELRDPSRYQRSYPLDDLAHAIGQPLRAPQSYQGLADENGWGKVVSILQMLNHYSAPPSAGRQPLHEGEDRTMDVIRSGSLEVSTD